MLLKWGAPIFIIIAGLLLAKLIFASRPEAEQRPTATPAPVKVEAMALVAQDYPIKIRSYGIVKPRIEGSLIPQVGGMIVKVSENFRAGGFYKKGEVLVEIDPRDYQNAYTIAEASYTQALVKLKEEQARNDQAKTNWNRLGKNTDASDLVLRLPQLAAARAALASAEAQLNQAQLDLERCKILAPYDGRLLKKYADLGQVVSKGSKLAEIYATDILEIRLPINNQQLQFIQIPNDVNAQPSITPPEVRISASTNPNNHWQGKVVRTEGSIDTQSRQLFVIAQIEQHKQDNEAKAVQSALKIGQFVVADIAGKILQDVFVIPRENIYQGNAIWLIQDGRLKKKVIDPIWKSDHVILTRSNLSNQDQLVTTPLLSAISGREVEIIGSSISPVTANEKFSGAENNTAAGTPSPSAHLESKPSG